MGRPERLLKHYSSLLEEPSRVSSKQWFDVRKKVGEALKDLALFAQRMPSSQFDLAFTEKSLEPLIRGIMEREPSPFFPNSKTRSEISTDPNRFRIGCMLLRDSITATGALLRNPFAGKLWVEKEVSFRDLIESLVFYAKREADVR